jgi:hypothetical protein
MPCTVFRDWIYESQFSCTMRLLILVVRFTVNVHVLLLDLNAISSHPIEGTTYVATKINN